jgi:hypothetical protein
LKNQPAIAGPIRVQGNPQQAQHEAGSRGYYTEHHRTLAARPVPTFTPDNRRENRTRLLQKQTIIKNGQPVLFLCRIPLRRYGLSDRRHVLEPGVQRLADGVDDEADLPQLLGVHDVVAVEHESRLLHAVEDLLVVQGLELNPLGQDAQTLGVLGSFVDVPDAAHLRRWGSPASGDPNRTCSSPGPAGSGPLSPGGRRC